MRSENRILIRDLAVLILCVVVFGIIASYYSHMNQYDKLVYFVILITAAVSAIVMRIIFRLSRRFETSKNTALLMAMCLMLLIQNVMVIVAFNSTDLMCLFNK